MNLFLYNFLVFMMLPFMVVRIFIKSFSDADYKLNFLNRFGIYKNKNQSKNVVWFHAVSLGEVISSEKIVSQILKDYKVVLSVSTPTGLREAQKIFGSKLEVVYAPWDFIFFVSLFFKTYRPQALILFETEIWPSMIFKAHSVKIPIVISNGRLSKKSFNRYKKSFITTKTMKKISHIFAQSSNHKKRFHRLGVPLEKIKEVGSAKFDYDIYNNGINVNNKGRQIILAASTHKKEDELIIAAFKRLSFDMPEVELIIVPRHPERAKSIQNLLDIEGMNSEVLASIPNNNNNKNKISIISATGILKELYPLASIAFIGGSLFKEYGGHNVIEAASQKCPFIVGPYTYNFEDVILKFKENESCVQLDINLDIFNAFKTLLSDNNLRDNMANKALDVCIKNTGSSDIQYNNILNIIREDKS